MLIQEQMDVAVVKFMAFVILLSSFAAADSRSKQKALEQSQLNVIHGSQDINDDMAERLWRNCRLDLINAKESVEDFELFVSGSNEIDSCRWCAKEIIDKTSSAVDPLLKQTLLTCLRKKNLMFLLRPGTPKRRKLVQSFAEEPVPSPGVRSPNVDPLCTNHEVRNTRRTSGSSRKSFANSVNKDNPGNQSLKLSLSFNDNFYLESDILNNAEESVQVPPSPVKNPTGRLDTQLSSLKPPLTTQASLRPSPGRLDSQLSSSKPPLGKLGSQKSSDKPPLGKLHSQKSSVNLPPGSGAHPHPPPGNGTPPPPPSGNGAPPTPPPPSLNPAPGAPRPPGPPPPPPPGGTGPRPPPPPGGAPRPPGLRPLKNGPPLPPGAGETGTPKAKLKPFFWDKVMANPDSTMVWHQLNAGSFQFNEEMIESLFGYNAENKSGPKKDSSSQDSSPQFIQLIDQKKSQNLAILLKALNVTTDEVCDALQEGNELPSELVRTLIKMAPTSEEELKLRLFSGDRSRLGTAEQFLKVIVDIPYAFKRLESLLFMRSLQDELSLIKESFATLEAACRELRKSRLFLKLLEAVLKTGNRMNVGTYRGSAQAFKLDTLLKLSDVKGSDGKITLLHFVVQEIIRSEGVRAARNIRESQSSISSISDDLLEDPFHDSEDHLRELGLQVVSGLGSELENVKKAAVLDADNITGTVSQLGHSLIKARDFLNTDMKNIDDDNGFHKTLKSFIQNAEGDIVWLLEEEKRIMALVKSTADYFHGNAKKDEGLRLFAIVRDFLIILDKACKEVKSTPRKKAQRKEGSNSSEQPRQSTSDNPFDLVRLSTSDNPFETPRQSISDNPLDQPCQSFSNNNPLEPARRSVSNNTPEPPRQSISDNRQRFIPAIADRRVHSSSSSDDDSP
ncbi:hypothetical protein LguiA_023226 [Lonicera macranthoides]